ncbi:MAG: ABC transporter permease [Terriglobia bacterium]
MNRTKSLSDSGDDQGFAKRPVHHTPRDVGAAHEPSSDATASGTGLDALAEAEAEKLIIASIAIRHRAMPQRLLFQIGHLWPLAVFFVVWEVVSIEGQRIDPQFNIILPPPTSVISAARDLVARGELLPNVVASLRRVLVAVGVASALGIPLGLSMGRFPAFKGAIDPLLEFIRPIPPLAWIPLSILWFGTGDTQIEYIIFLAAFFPIVLNAMAGAHDVDAYLIRAGLSLGARGWALFYTVILPGSLPSVMTGVRIGLGIGWMALVAGELVAAHSGLGYMINNAQLVFRSDVILLGMVLIGLLGLVLDYGIRMLSLIVIPWHVRA